MAPVEGLLAPDLAKTIAMAEAKNDAAQKAAPDEKPPLGDGVPWQGFPDAAPKCAAGAATVAANGKAGVGLTYTFPKTPKANWTDRLALVRIDGKWRIDDVIYSDRTTLRAALTDAFAP